MWRKAKLALGLNLCMHVPRNLDESPSVEDSAERSSDVALLSNALADSSLGLSESSEMCSICLTKMKQGGGHAIFTAECSHSFHFHCIASNVKHGNQICPICRATWKEIPVQGPSLNLPPGQASVSTVGWPQNDAVMTMIRQIPPVCREINQRHVVPVIQAPDPSVFNDDESLNQFPGCTKDGPGSKNAVDYNSSATLKINTYAEISGVPRHQSYDNFAVLVHLKAASRRPNPVKSVASHPQQFQGSRAPVDLVTVLDISGSMSGTKLALLKRAMGFVIQNLSGNDRLSVIAFSSTARRLFPLRRMSEIGRQQALLAVNSLVANGGTNIAEGLRKGAKIMEERREKNPVASLILLSDGQDTYTINCSVANQPQPNYKQLLPLSIHTVDNMGSQIPVHTFGFGLEHDASLMHSISETSGGTFSFIENEAVIQDAFAQCIGGLLSVVVQDLRVNIECVDPRIHLGSIRAGSYRTQVISGGQVGCIEVGDLYVDEERDFLVFINVPAESSNVVTSLVKVKCSFKDPINKEISTTESNGVKIERSEAPEQGIVSIEVDRQKNRLQAADAMAQARNAAEQGELSAAVSILENCRRVLLQTVSSRPDDQLCIALDFELKQMQERMTTRQTYESSGRAYILSGLSSHSWQRTTTRGYSTDGSGFVPAYQTPSMVDMLTRSHTMSSGSPSAQGHFGSQPSPR